jgi:hypothetical protein
MFQIFSQSSKCPYLLLEAGRFVLPFKLERMTWIKPSFNWMMYRSGYGSKQGQEMILVIDLARKGFDWALERGVLSHFVPEVHGTLERWKKQVAQSDVRIQWDPERDCRIQPITGVRSLQMGLSGAAVPLFVYEWIVALEDMTPVAHALAQAKDCKTRENWPHTLERVYG